MGAKRRRGEGRIHGEGGNATVDAGSGCGVCRHAAELVGIHPEGGHHGESAGGHTAVGGAFGEIRPGASAQRTALPLERGRRVAGGRSDEGDGVPGGGAPVGGLGAEHRRGGSRTHGEGDYGAVDAGSGCGVCRHAAERVGIHSEGGHHGERTGGHTAVGGAFGEIRPGASAQRTALPLERGCRVARGRSEEGDGVPGGGALAGGLGAKHRRDGDRIHRKGGLCADDAGRGFGVGRHAAELVGIHLGSGMLYREAGGVHTAVGAIVGEIRPGAGTLEIALPLERGCRVARDCDREGGGHSGGNALVGRVGAKHRRSEVTHNRWSIGHHTRVAQAEGAEEDTVATGGAFRPRGHHIQIAGRIPHGTHVGHLILERVGGIGAEGGSAGTDFLRPALGYGVQHLEGVGTVGGRLVVHVGVHGQGLGAGQCQPVSTVGGPRGRVCGPQIARRDHLLRRNPRLDVFGYTRVADHAPLGGGIRVPCRATKQRGQRGCGQLIDSDRSSRSQVATQLGRGVILPTAEIDHQAGGGALTLEAEDEVAGGDADGVRRLRGGDEAQSQQG